MPRLSLFTVIWAALLAICAGSPINPLKVLSFSDDGSFTFSLTGPANYSVNTESFWTGIYYVPPLNKSAPVAKYDTASLSGLVATDSHVPFTVFVTDAEVVTDDVLHELVAEYSKDDVFTTDFLKGVQVICSGPCTTAESALDHLRALGVEFAIVPSSAAPPRDNSFPISIVNGTQITPPGPYIAKITKEGSISVNKVYAMFSDYQGSFYNGLTKNDDHSYSAVAAWNPSQFSPLIPFPSKLYSSLMDKTTYPLAGLRFGLKDLMPVKGVVLTGGSRAYARLHETPANETAPAIERLLELGAVLVGMSKLTTFAYGAYPYQTMDYSYSWNVRADGFLGLSASSFGPAAAIAAYDQLDFTIGSDTLGSVRNPADRAGVYGIRPSWGVIDLTNVIPSATSLDTLGVLARSPTVLHRVMGAWQSVENTPFPEKKFTLPKKIIYPVEWFPVNSSAAQTLIDGWLSDMANAMGMEIVEQNVTTLFHETINQNDTLSSYTADFGSLTAHDNWNLFGKNFVADYQEKFDGRWPEADNQVLQSWREALDYPESRKQWNEDRLVTFKNFINDKVIPYSDESCTEGLWVYQIADTGGGVPEYRDVLNYDYFPPFEPMRAASIAPFAKLVDITVPIGTVPYESVISLREEELVITLSFVAHSGCDAVLMDFVSGCAAAGFCKSVKTGITAW